MPWQERHSRLTTFFRWLHVIPARSVARRSGRIALIVTVPVAWFALLFTGRYPESLYEFHASFARYATKVYALLLLATDHWPGFSGSSDDGLSGAARLGPPLTGLQPAEGRAAHHPADPRALIAYAMQIVAEIAVVHRVVRDRLHGQEPRGRPLRCCASASATSSARCPTTC